MLSGKKACSQIAACMKCRFATLMRSATDYPALPDQRRLVDIIIQRLTLVRYPKPHSMRARALQHILRREHPALYSSIRPSLHCQGAVVCSRLWVTICHGKRFSDAMGTPLGCMALATAWWCICTVSDARASQTCPGTDTVPHLGSAAASVVHTWQVLWDTARPPPRSSLACSLLGFPAPSAVGPPGTVSGDQSVSNWPLGKTSSRAPCRAIRRRFRSSARRARAFAWSCMVRHSARCTSSLSFCSCAKSDAQPSIHSRAISRRPWASGASNMAEKRRLRMNDQCWPQT